MIRRLLLLMLVGIGFFACKEDDELVFDVPTEFRDVTFEPTAGGAVMRYFLPNNTDIFGVRVRYTNAWNEPQVKEGSYLADSILIDGFTEPRTGVPAQVTFFDHNMAESEPIEVTFDTEAAATVSIFDNLTVNPYWGGFTVVYNAPETVNGIIHISYLGINPMTHEPDSILMSSVPIVEGGDTLNFQLQQTVDSLTVFIRTDNYSGYRVRQDAYDIPNMSMDTLTPADFQFRFTGEIQNDPAFALGEEYLFDGDKKGLNYKKNRRAGDEVKFSTFVAGPNAFDERFIVDLGEAKIPAAVNLYAYIFWNTQWSKISYNNEDYPKLNDIWSGYYSSRLPAKITLYGTNDPNPETVDLSTCARLYGLDDNVDFEEGFANSWAKYTDEYQSQANVDKWWGGPGEGWMSYYEETDEVIAEADDVVLSMLCNYTGEAYQYLIFVVEDTYNSMRYLGREENPKEYVTFNELEVCVKAEEE